MNRRRRQQIYDLADRIRDALDLVPPVNMTQAVEKLGGKLVELAPSEDQAEAMVEKRGDAFVISISPQAGDARTRFSIAHEIGHLFLHMGYLIDPQKWRSMKEYRDSAMYRFGYSEEELEANEFAAAFLMPKPLFENVAAKHYQSGVYDLKAIADEFDVSLAAARTRGRWLGLFSWDD